MSATPRVSNVPGPPRGRRQPVLDDVLDRVDAMREAERDNSSLGGALLRLLSDVVLLLKDLATDPRVSTRDKFLAGCAAAYLVSPLNLVPSVLPIVGQADDLVVAAWSFRRLLGAAGYDVIYELWRGSDEGLALVLTLAGVQE